jgi:hypothetical protein
MKNRLIISGILLIGVLVLTSSFEVATSTSITPVANCNMEITKVNDSTYVVQNYTGSFTIENKILAGSPQITVSSDTIHVSGANYGLVIMATDVNGCVTHQTINKY